MSLMSSCTEANEIPAFEWLQKQGKQKGRKKNYKMKIGKADGV